MEPNLNNTSPVVQPEQNQPVQPMQPVQPVQPAQDDGKKKKGILIIFIILGLCLIGALVVIFVPWSKIFGNTSTNKEDESSVAKDNTDGAYENDTTTSNDGGVCNEKNNFKIFEGYDCVAELAMGTNINGVQTPLLNIKIPFDYNVSASFLNDNGIQMDIIAFDGSQYKKIVQSKEYKNNDKLPCFLVARDVDDIFAFRITESKEYSVETIKANSPNGIDLHKDSTHKAYITEMSGYMDILEIYEINEDYSLLIEYTGDLLDRLSLEEIGEEFYNLVTVLE